MKKYISENFTWEHINKRIGAYVKDIMDKRTVIINLNCNNFVMGEI